MVAAMTQGSTDERLARLESNVEHIQKDVTESRTDVRRLDARMEAMGERLEAKMYAMGERLEAKMYAMGERLEAKMYAMGERLEAKMQAMGERLEAKMYAMGASLEARMYTMQGGLDTRQNSLDAAINALRVEIVRRSLGDRIRTLLMNGATLGVMAHGFKWI